MTTLHAVSTFSGIGGIDLAFHRAGVPGLLMCEADKSARSVLSRRFPGMPIHPDIKELTADDLRAAGAVPDRCERLQGYPDGWTEGRADSPRYRQLGNSVAVPVFEWVARRLVAMDAALIGEAAA